MLQNPWYPSVTDIWDTLVHLGLTLALTFLSISTVHLAEVHISASDNSTALVWSKDMTRAVASNTNPSADLGLEWVSLWNKVSVSAAVTLKKIECMLDSYIMQSSERSSETQGLTSLVLSLSRGCSAVSYTRNHRAFGFLALGNILAALSSIHWPVYVANGMYLQGLQEYK